MAFMGNMTTANADEINPNNFASRPGVFSVKSTTSSDYLFGSNMGLQTPENNLTISHSKIKRSLPYPTTLGDCGPGHLGSSRAERMTIYNQLFPALAFGGGYMFLHNQFKEAGAPSWAAAVGAVVTASPLLFLGSAMPRGE